MTLIFGIFMAPFHCPVGQNPTTAIARDVDVVQLIDKLGYDEAWIGEHHSCGTEIIADPRSSSPTLPRPGTSSSAPASCRCRTTTRCGWPTARSCSTISPAAASCSASAPARCPTDAAMIGIALEEQRTALEDDIDVLMRCCAASR